MTWVSNAAYAAMLADWHAPANELPEIATLVAHVLEHEAVGTAWTHHGFWRVGWADSSSKDQKISLIPATCAPPLLSIAGRPVAAGFNRGSGSAARRLLPGFMGRGEAELPDKLGKLLAVARQPVGHGSGLLNHRGILLG